MKYVVTIFHFHCAEVSGGTSSISVICFMAVPHCTKGCLSLGVLCPKAALRGKQWKWKWALSR